MVRTLKRDTTRFLRDWVDERWLHLFVLATYCNVVFNADADQSSPGFSAIGLGNEQEEGITHISFSPKIVRKLAAGDSDRVN